MGEGGRQAGRGLLLLFGKGQQNAVAHAAQIREHIMIPGAMDLPSLRVQICAALSVMRHLSFGAMCCPINFNNKSMFTTAKIGKIWSDCKLSHEFESTKAPGPQCLPEQTFGLRVLFP